jgi:hypothetical protein
VRLLTVSPGREARSSVGRRIRHRNAASANRAPRPGPATGGLLTDVGPVPGALGYAQAGDVAAHQGGGVQPVALDGLSPAFGDIGRSAGQYPFWTVEYLYTCGRAIGLAAAFLRYLGGTAAVSDLEAAQYTPCPADRSGRAGALCAQAGP